MAWRLHFHSFVLLCLGPSFVLTGCAKDSEMRLVQAPRLAMAMAMADLAGSTFAVIPLADSCDAEPFPAPIYRCSML